MNSAPLPANSGRDAYHGIQSRSYMVRKIGEDAPEQKVIDDIAEYGWHCVNILAEGDLPGFAFTVGNFESHKHPEFIIFGLRSEVAHRVLDLAVSGLKSGAIFDLSVSTYELLNDYPCVFVQVPEAEYRSRACGLLSLVL